MADPNLMERLAAGVFDPPVAYAHLADYHLDFDQLVRTSPEASARERAERMSGCCVIVGTGGSGKSSLIASVAASLSPTRFPVRIQGVSDAGALTREGFAAHIGHETLRALRAMELGRPRERRLRPARDALAASVTHQSAGRSLSLGLALGVEATAQFASSAREVVEQREPAAIAAAIDQLVRVTERFERRILLIVEDTDVFMPPDPLGEGEEQRPRRFVDHVVSYLAREFPSSSLVAVNTRYQALIPRGTVAVVEIPSLRLESVGRLIEHYARCAGLAITAEQIIHADALAYVAGRYAESGDIRRMLELLHKATRRMVGEGRGDLITVDVLHGL